MNDAPEVTDLEAGLERIASSPPPPSRVDIARARARGRRILRTRRTVAVTAAGVATAAVLTGIPSLGVDSPTSPSATPTAAAVPDYANPLIGRASFGWLPNDYGIMTSIADRQSRSTFTVTAKSGALTQPIQLTDFGEGPEPALGFRHGGKPAKRIPAAPVSGHSAYWIAKPGSEDGGRLRWRYGPKSWAEVEVSRGANDTIETIYRIARTVRFGRPQPSRFPLHVRKVPEGLFVYRAVLNTAPIGVDLQFRGTKPGDLTISMEDDNMSSRRGLLPNTSIDGYPAYDSRLGPPPGSPKPQKVEGQQLWVFGVQGYDVRMFASGDPLRQLASTGGLPGLFRRITVIGDNWKRWTTRPLD